MAAKTYGVSKAGAALPDDPPWLAATLESLERVGFALLPTELDTQLLERLRMGLEGLLEHQTQRFGGVAALEAIGEAGQARALCSEDPLFWDLITLPHVNAIVERLLGPAAIVMQQNGVVMPPSAGNHHQQRWHRDLPYQTWVGSRPIAIGSLCALDPFSQATGGTAFLPASHRFADFPSDGFVERWEHVIEAPAGSIIVFDAMTFHRGGINTSARHRRAVNTLFGVPLLAQQVVLSPPAHASELIMRRSGLQYRSAASADDYRARRAARAQRVSHGG